MGYFVTETVSGSLSPRQKTATPANPGVESGLRLYSTTLARWTSRDPIEEDGGLHLYGFVGNETLSKWDYLGMDPVNEFPIVISPVMPDPTPPPYYVIPIEQEPRPRIAYVSDCEIVIFVGHGPSSRLIFFPQSRDDWRESTMNPDNGTLPYEIRTTPCSAATAVGCRSGIGYTGYIDEETGQPGNELPGYEPPTRPITIPGYIEQINAAIEAARKHQDSLCDSPCCCKSVTIRVDSPQAFSEWAQSGVNLGWVRLEPLLKFSETKTCEK